MPRLTLPEKTPDVLSPGIRQDAIIMRSGMGESVLVPKSKYEEFESFLKSKSSLPTAMAKDALERLELDVGIDQLTARYKVNALANLSEANSTWVSVPIALGSLQPIPSLSEGIASEFPPLRVSQDSTGYVWRVAPGSLGIRDLHFDAISKVRALTQGYSLRLDLPPVQTIVRFELPPGQWDLNLVGNGSEIAEPFQDKGGKSIAIIRSSGGTLTLSWARKEFAEKVQAIEVESNTKYVPLMEAGGFRAAASLTIRGPQTLGGRRFLIALPPTSQWREPMTTSLSFPGYRLGRSEASDGNADTVLVLEFEESFSRTEIELTIEWQTSFTAESNRMNFSMLRVEGVQRHEGNIEIGAPRNVSFRWDPQSSIQFARQSQSGDGSDLLVYTFRLQQQDEPLRVEWIVGDRASDLKAFYNVEVDATLLRLNGTIDFLGDVRSLPFLQLDVRGWTVDRVQLQPSGRELDLIAIRSRSTVTAGGTQQSTSIPLSLGELLDAVPPRTGTVGTNRPTDGTTAPSEPGMPSQPSRDENTRQPTRSISFVLSIPKGQLVDPDGLKQEFGFWMPMLSWLDSESQQRQFLCVGGEMSIRSSASELEPSAKLQESFKQILDRNAARRYSALKYRVEKAKSWLEWNGSYETRGAAIGANAQTRIEIGPESRDIIQTWKLSQANGRTKSLRLALPKDWSNETTQHEKNLDDSESVRLTLDDLPISIKPIPVIDKERLVPFISTSFEQRYDWMQIELPAPQRNDEMPSERKLIIRKKINHESPLSSNIAPFDWLLPWIAEDTSGDTLDIGKYSGEVVLSGGVRCVLQSPLGGRDGSVGESEMNSKLVSFDRTQMEPRLIGILSLPSVPDEKAVDIESVWLQTIVNAIEQRDRFVIRFDTRGDSLSLKLPAMRLANSEFIVNGRKIVPSRNDNNQVDLLLDPDSMDLQPSTKKSYVLEVFIWSERKSQWLKSLRTEPLTIIHSTSRAPFAWQVVVPSTVHVIGNTSTLSPGYHWKWQDLWFGRKSDWNQDSLANFMGATAQPFVSQLTNQYVFFSLDHTVPMGVLTAPRYLLWAPVALFVLFVSFSAMEFRWIRKPWILIVLLLLGLAFSQWAWDLSIALAQCLVVAFGIAGTYALLKWGVDRRARRRSVFASRPSTPIILTASRTQAPSGVAIVSKSVAVAASTTHAADGDGGQ